MRDEVLTGFHYLGEGQAEAPPVEAVQEKATTTNSST